MGVPLLFCCMAAMFGKEWGMKRRLNIDGADSLFWGRRYRALVTALPDSSNVITKAE